MEDGGSLYVPSPSSSGPTMSTTAAAAAAAAAVDPAAVRTPGGLAAAGFS